jgi:glycosyltransferase involved in cell wall biosynthesis
MVEPAGTGAAQTSGTDAVTPVILTLNEAPNIGRCLERLTWARRIVVLDSGSLDATAEVVARFPNTELHHRPFDNHTAQWMHALSLASTPWVLTLDADYLAPASFAGEAGAITADAGLDAAFATFRYLVLGRPVRASLYPPRPVLFRRDRCRYEQDGHTQRLVIPGRTRELTSVFEHDDRKPLRDWFAAQDRYTRLEVDKLRTAPDSSLSFQDRLRRLVVPAPFAVFLYTFVARGAFLDGWPGWYYTLQRTLAEVMLSLHLLDDKLRRS